MFRRRAGLPPDWTQIVSDRMAHWAQLDDHERETLAEAADWLLRKKHWECAAGFDGFDLTDEIRVTISAQAALLVLGLDVDYYRDVASIVVWPSTIVHDGEYAGAVAGTAEAGPVPVLGLAHDRRGPVLIAWDEAVSNARHPERGHNVVYHEFAHKIDMYDGMVDGTPPLFSRHKTEQWVATCSPIYESMVQGAERPPLRDYGATDVGEFFAVATEAFFDEPLELERNEPALYDVLADFYRQDPAERARRATGAPMTRSSQPPEIT